MVLEALKLRILSDLTPPKKRFLEAEETLN